MAAPPAWVVGGGGHGWTWPIGVGCRCGWAPASTAPSSICSFQLREHVLWGCSSAQVVRSIIQFNLPEGVSLLPKHLWLLDPPRDSLSQEVWYVVGLASLGVLLRAKWLLDKGGLDLVRYWIPSLLGVALDGFASSQGPSFSLGASLSSDHPFLYSRQGGLVVCSLHVPQPSWVFSRSPSLGAFRPSVGFSTLPLSQGCMLRIRYATLQIHYGPSKSSKP